MEYKTIRLRKLVANPANPNVISSSNFVKLARNIGKTGFYEPLLVRPLKIKKGYYQIINGYHRSRILLKLRYATVDCIVVGCDDVQANILLATLNRLGGKDEISRKIDLLKCLLKDMSSAELGKVLLQTKMQVEKLTNFKLPKGKKGTKSFLNSLVFFLTDKQKGTVEKAFSLLTEQVKDEKTEAAKKAASLVVLAEYFIDHAANKSPDSE